MPVLHWLPPDDGTRKYSFTKKHWQQMISCHDKLPAHSGWSACVLVGDCWTCFTGVERLSWYLRLGFYLYFVHFIRDAGSIRRYTVVTLYIMIWDVFPLWCFIKNMSNFKKNSSWLDPLSIWGIDSPGLIKSRWRLSKKFDVSKSRSRLSEKNRCYVRRLMVFRIYPSPTVNYC